MRSFAFPVVAVLLTMPSVLQAAECAPLDPATFSCQDQIAKSGAYYAKAHLGAVQTCLAGFQKGKITGPDAATVCRGSSLVSLPTDMKAATKITGAVGKAVDQIAKKCNDMQVASLGLCAGTVSGLGTCLFAQHFAAVDGAIGAEVGTLAVTSDAALQKCQTTINKESGSTCPPA